MQMEIPRSRPALFGLGRKINNGLKKFASGANPAIPLKQTTEANFLADYTAAAAAEDLFQESRTLKSDAITRRDGIAGQADQFMALAKATVFRKLFGPRWSVQWAQIGFKTGSIETPTSLDGKLEVLRGMASWFSRNLDKEVTVGEEEISHVKAGQLEAALSDAINTVETGKSDTDEKEAARDAAEEGLRKRIRVLIDELTFLLDPMDARWPAFGLNKPGETERPDPVTDIQVDTSTPGILRYHWEPPPRAVRFKVLALVVGKDEAFAVIDEVFDPEVVLTSYSPGTQLRMKIVAVNGAGDSAASPEMSAQVPALAAA